MRRVGLIGGLSWESTRLYYDAINRAVAARLGGAHSAPLIIDSLDFAPIARAQAEGRWDDAGAAVVDAAQRLGRAGVDAVAIASNTMHKCADSVRDAVRVPLLHIVDPLREALAEEGRKRPLLLATRFTMEQDYIRAPLAEAGIEARIPDDEDRETIHRTIYEELIRGVVSEASRETFLAIIAKGREAGADSVILGCTEIGLLVTADNSPLPVYDTMTLHAAAITDFILYGV
ncbi:MAG TPA: amino acid racemase [Croceibacterium sp.]|nr:amino acid racemase [Croceibacterium sp.]